MSNHPPISDHERNHILSDLGREMLAVRHAMAGATILLDAMESKVKLLVNDAVDRQESAANDDIPDDLRDFLGGILAHGQGFTVLRRDM